MQRFIFDIGDNVDFVVPVTGGSPNAVEFLLRDPDGNESAVSATEVDNEWTARPGCFVTKGQYYGRWNAWYTGEETPTESEEIDIKVKGSKFSAPFARS